MSDEHKTDTLRGSEVAVELAKEWNEEATTDQLEVELRSGVALIVDVVDGELRIRRSRDIE